MKLLLLVGLATIGFTQIQNKQRWGLVLVLTIIACVTTMFAG